MDGAFFVFAESMRQRYPNIKINKKLKIVLLSVAAFLVFILLIFRFSKPSIVNTVDDASRIQIANAVSTTEVDREFRFPIKDGEGNEVSQFILAIDKAELRDQIIVQGKRATSVEGRTFLIVDLEIKNDYTQTIEIDTSDYFRLTMNGNEDMKLAPDIHNDPVEVQAISTKLTRVGFPVNDTDNSFVLHVGEINGDKERIELNLQYK